MKKKLLYIGLGILAVVMVYIGYEYIRFLKATSRMKELSADLERRITEWEKKEYKRSPLFGPAVPGNAAEFYRQVENIIRDPANGPSDISFLLGDAIDYPTRPFSPEVQAYYEHNKHITGIVQNGVNAEAYKLRINIRLGLKYKNPELSAIKTVSELMVLRGRELEKDGQILEALRIYCGIIRFGYDQRYWGGVLSGVASLMVIEIGEKEMQRLLLKDILSENNLTFLLEQQRMLQKSDGDLYELWDVEQMLLEMEIRQFAEKIGFIDMPKQSLNNITLGTRSVIVECWEDILTIYPELKSICFLPFVQIQDEEKKIDTKTRARKNPISKVGRPSATTIKTEYSSCLSLQKGVDLLAALRLYRIRNGIYPDSLSALSPEIIPEVPLDPFSDRPFIYKVDNDQNIYLYSVGPDLKDDGGDEKGGKDIVITVPPKK